MSSKPNQHELDLVKAQKKALAKTQETLAIDKLKSIEDEMLAAAYQTIEPVLKFSKINPGSDLVPQEWVGLPIDEQQRLMRLANAAWMSNKDAPIGIKLAFQTVASILDARSKRESGAKVLNIENAQFISPVPQFDIIDMDE